jgi:hypothetical protein
MSLKPLPLSNEIESIARRVVWFEDPILAIAHTPRFLAYIMTYGTFRDMDVIGELLTEDDLREGLDLAPAGIFDERSWAYWNVKLGRYPVPPMPERKLNAVQSSKN